VVAPVALLAAETQAQSAGQELVGIYHSHPQGEATPSERDRAEAWPALSYVILAGPQATARSFRLNASGAFDEQSLLTTQEPRA